MKWWQLTKRDADLERELRSDLELEEEEQRENGLSPEEARHAARRAFGNTTLIRQQTHEAWGWTPVERLLQDARYTFDNCAGHLGSRLSPCSSWHAASAPARPSSASSIRFLLHPYAFRDPGQIVVWREVLQKVAKEYLSVPDNYRHFVYLRSHAASTIQDAAFLLNASFAVAADGDHPRMRKGSTSRLTSFPCWV
jgi:hypothetical protein